jgi:C4-dicarboxylate-specific signal transduction histidine kinase
LAFTGPPVPAAIAAGVFAIAVFIIDTLTTLDIAVAVLYVVVVLVAANCFQRPGVLLAAAGCMALTLTSFLVSHGLSTGTPLVRCLVSLAAIAATTALALERNRTQEALQRAQAELAHVARLTTLGELTASIAHEVNQPLAGIVTNGAACLRWLSRAPAQLDEARGAVESMISDGMRASEVLSRLRTLARKTTPQRARVDLNEEIKEVARLIGSELRNHRVLLRPELAQPAPVVIGDRIQIQQVIMNLMINAIQAMASLTDHSCELSIRSQRREEGDQVICAQ